MGRVALLFERIDEQSLQQSLVFHHEHDGAVVGGATHRCPVLGHGGPGGGVRETDAGLDACGPSRANAKRPVLLLDQCACPQDAGLSSGRTHRGWRSIVENEYLHEVRVFVLFRADVDLTAVFERCTGPRHEQLQDLGEGARVTHDRWETGGHPDVELTGRSGGAPKAIAFTLEQSVQMDRTRRSAGRRPRAVIHRARGAGHAFSSGRRGSFR